MAALPELEWKLLTCEEYHAMTASGILSEEDKLELIEVSDATLEKDRLIKGPLYAQAEIPVYWIANLVDHQLEVYSEPKQGQYTLRRILLPEEEVALPGFEIEVGVAELLG